jgi:hypothetical protein
MRFFDLRCRFIGIVKKAFCYWNVFFRNPSCRVALIRNKIMKSGMKLPLRFFEKRFINQFIYEYKKWCALIGTQFSKNLFRGN